MYTVKKQMLGMQQEGPRTPQIVHHHTNETQLSSAQKPQLSSGMVISRLIFNFSPQNGFSHRTAPTETPKMSTLEKRIFPHSQFERVIFLFILLESGRISFLENINPKL